MSTPSMRAACEIFNARDNGTKLDGNALAAIIERETGCDELLAALKQCEHILKYDARNIEDANVKALKMARIERVAKAISKAERQ